MYPSTRALKYLAASLGTAIFTMGLGMMWVIAKIAQALT